MWNLLPISLLVLEVVLHPPDVLTNGSVSFESYIKEAQIKNTLISKNTTPISSPTPSSTASPVPTKTSIQSPSQSLSDENSIQSYLLKEVNKYRSSKGLASVSMNTQVCDFAKTRAGEIASNFNHDGFSRKIESKTLPYSSYSEVTENIAMTSSSTDVVSIWINSSGHRANMEKDTPYVCIEKNGDYYAYEGWKP